MLKRLARSEAALWLIGCAFLGFVTVAYAAGSTLSSLTAVSSVAGTDLFYDVQTGGSGGLKATAAQIATYVQSVGGLATVNGAVKSNGSGTYSHAACADLTNASVYCSATQGQLPGTTTNDNASAGNIGEDQNSAVVHNSVASLTDATATNLTSKSLTAGDWQVTGTCNFGGGSTTTTLTYLGCGINTTTGSLPADPFTAWQWLNGVAPFATLNYVSIAAPTYRITLNAPGTVFLVGIAHFGTSTLTGGGLIDVRRPR